MPIVSLALRSWLRYVIPLTVVSAVVLSPLVIYALATSPAQDVATAKAQVTRGYELLAIAWVLQLAIVGGVAPAVFAVARSERAPQADILGLGLRRAVRTLAPAALAAIAVVIGGLALVVPGLVLLALLAPVGASDELSSPLPRALVDTVAVSRRDLAAAALAVASLIAIDCAIPIAASQLVLLPLPPKKPPPELLESARDFIRVIAFALVVASPVPACAIAAAYARSRARSQDPDPMGM